VKDANERDRDSIAASGLRSPGRLVKAVHPAQMTLVAVIVVWCVAFGRLAALRQDRFGTFGFDLGIYDQGVWLLAHGRDPFVTVRGLDLFGHHMNVLFLAIAPFYRLGGGPDFLLMVQLAAQASGAVALYLLGRDALGSRWAGVGVAVALLLNPTYQWLVWEFFHPDAVSIAPLLFAYWAARQERWGWFTVAAVLALACKEDVALSILVLGLLIAFRFHASRPRVTLGLGTLAVGVLVPIQAEMPVRIGIAMAVIGAGIAIALVWGGDDPRWSAAGLTVAAIGALVPIPSGSNWKLVAGGVVALAGAALALDRKPQWRKGVVAALLAGAWFVIATRVLIPIFNGVGPFYDSFFPPELGSTPTDMVRNTVHHPSRAYDLVDEPTRVTWYWRMLAPWALLPLLHLRTFVIAAPMIAVDVLTAFPYTRDYRYHYSSIVLAGCALASVEAIAMLQRKAGGKPWVRNVCVLGLLGAALISTYQWGASPLAHDYRSIWPLRADPATSARAAAVDRLPEDESVSASYSFVPHVGHRERVYEYPVPWCNINWGVDGENLHDPADVEWLLIDTRLLVGAERERALFEDLLTNEFTVRYERDGIILAQRTAPPTFVRTEQPAAFQCEPRPSIAAFG
jgi:uncharacterized membrane protein